MILYDGKTYESSEQDRLLSELEQKIPELLAREPLSPEVVIEAVECLREDLLEGKFDDLLSSFPKDTVDSYKRQATLLLSKEHMHQKLATELGNTEEYVTDPVEGFARIRVRKMPLGVLFHISAGNMDFLPAYSLAEGLMTGNINILKLPSADNGLSLKLILQLIEYRPTLKDYIYVFDTASTDIQGMKKMAGLSHAISVWGSDMAISALREMAPTGAKIIEWGQKLGFCYISGYSFLEDIQTGENHKTSSENDHDHNQTITTDGIIPKTNLLSINSELVSLARHIATTRQLLCSSCQVIYLDTENMTEVRAFAEHFLPLLEEAVSGHASEDIGIRARDTLLSYTQRLKQYLGTEEKKENVLTGRGVSLILGTDSALELSPMMGNVLVKPLPRHKLPEVLYRHRHHLQTAGLICPEDEREKLSSLLIHCGLVRVTKAGDMSEYFSGECHDGEYALGRYMRVVNVEE